jgi:hypothetical protein
LKKNRVDPSCLKNGACGYRLAHGGGRFNEFSVTGAPAMLLGGISRLVIRFDRS